MGCGEQHSGPHPFATHCLCRAQSAVQVHSQVTDQTVGSPRGNLALVKPSDVRSHRRGRRVQLLVLRSRQLSSAKVGRTGQML